MFNPLALGAPTVSANKMKKTYLELAEEFVDKFQGCTSETEFAAESDGNGIEIRGKNSKNIYCVEHAALFSQYNNLGLYIGYIEIDDELIPVLRMF